MKHWKWGKAAALIAAVLLIISNLAAPAAAGSGLGKIVRVGYVNFENFQEGGEGEYKRGFGYEYLQRVAYSTGWKYEYVYGNFNELLEMLKEGKIDLMGDLTYTEERAESISFSALPQGKETFYIYTTATQEAIDPFDLDTLNGRRIGVTAGSYQQSLLVNWIAESGYNCAVVEYPGTQQTTAAIERGEVDAIISTDMVSSVGYVPLVNIGYSEFYFGVSKDRPDLLEELNRALREIQAIDPYYNEVTYAKYIRSSVSNSFLSKQERSWLEMHNNTVHIGYLVENLPYCDTTAEGAPKGLMAVIADNFEKELGIQVTMREYPTAEAMVTAAILGEIDLFGPMYRDFWLSEQYGFFSSDAIATTTFILLYQGEYTEETTQRIAYAKNSSIQKNAAQVLYPEAKYIKCETREDCLEAVASGKASCTIVSAATMNLFKQYKAMKGLNMVELPRAAEICMGTLHGNSELLSITNRVIFASSEDLNGAALMENSYVEISFSMVDYLEEHALIVVTVLVVIILLMVAAFLSYLITTRRLVRMKTQNEELSRQAFRDELTKVGNRAGYLSAERELQKKVAEGQAGPFALVVADVNCLKSTNDGLGHEAGDCLIRNTSRCICNIYAHSPVFRIGGDEFAVILSGGDYERRHELLARLQEESMLQVDRQQVECGCTSVAFGMAEYNPETDHTVSEVLARADEAMYACKRRMKKEQQ